VTDEEEFLASIEKLRAYAAAAMKAVDRKAFKRWDVRLSYLENMLALERLDRRNAAEIFKPSDKK
jgi:hypothetical protein